MHARQQKIGNVLTCLHCALREAWYIASGGINDFCEIAHHKNIVTLRNCAIGIDDDATTTISQPDLQKFVWAWGGTCWRADFSGEAPLATLVVIEPSTV